MFIYISFFNKFPYYLYNNLGYIITQIPEVKILKKIKKSNIILKN